MCVEKNTTIRIYSRSIPVGTMTIIFIIPNPKILFSLQVVAEILVN